jgi:hypothetical protein
VSRGDRFAHRLLMPPPPAWKHLEHRGANPAPASKPPACSTLPADTSMHQPSVGPPPAAPQPSHAEGSCEVHPSHGTGPPSLYAGPVLRSAHSQGVSGKAAGTQGPAGPPAAGTITVSRVRATPASRRTYKQPQLPGSSNGHMILDAGSPTAAVRSANTSAKAQAPQKQEERPMAVVNLGSGPLPPSPTTPRSTQQHSTTAQAVHLTKVLNSIGDNAHELMAHAQNLKLVKHTLHGGYEPATGSPAPPASAQGAAGGVATQAAATMATLAATLNHAMQLAAAQHQGHGGQQQGHKRSHSGLGEVDMSAEGGLVLHLDSSAAAGAAGKAASAAQVATSRQDRELREQGLKRRAITICSAPAGSPLAAGRHLYGGGASG